MKFGRVSEYLKWTQSAIVRQEMTARTLGEAIVIGLLGGIAAIFFLVVLEASTKFFLGFLAGVVHPEPLGEPEIFAWHVIGTYRAWLVVLLPALGGLASGFIVQRFAPEAKGAGTDAMIESFHHNDGHVRARVPFVKGLASAFVLGTGGSAGREGPVIQIGAGIGSTLGRLFKVTPRRRRHLLLAGAAAGIGAVFRAPLGGAIVAVEILYREDFESEALVSCIIASVTGYSIFAHFLGHGTIFKMETVPAFTDIRELGLYLFLGCACALLGIVFVVAFRSFSDFFKELSVPEWVKPGIGGLGVGIIALFLPEVTGAGWGYLQEALLGKIAVQTMIIICLMKILTTCLTIGSGGSGGLFGPALFIGGMLGGTVGYFFNGLYPEIVSEPSSFILVGMAAFFAGVANAGIGALIMVAEISGSYRLIAPLMLVSVFSLVFTRKWGVYPSQVQTQFDSPAHRIQRIVDVLAEASVLDTHPHPITSEQFVTPGTSVSKLMRLVSENDAGFFVVGSPGKILGIIEAETLMSVIALEAVEGLVAADLAGPTTLVRAEDSLRTALNILVATNLDHVLVAEESDGETTYRVLSSVDLEQAYIKLASRGK